MQGIKPGIGLLSKNIEQQALETVTEHSYRKTERIVAKKLSKETIRSQVLSLGVQAQELPKNRKAGKVIPEKQLNSPSKRRTITFLLHSMLGTSWNF